MISETAPVPSSAPASLSDQDKKKITDEFKKALSQQKASLAHQERSTLRELKSSQKQKTRRWREDEKKKRRIFFDQHMSGPERREYVQKYLAEKGQFETGLKNELAEFKKTWTEKKQSLVQSQKELEKHFNESLGKGIRPPAELWPSGN